MLSITKRADYALLALAHLADSYQRTPGRLINTKEIAEQYEIPVELLAKIMQILAKSGMVASHPGPAGGYRLVRSAAAISVAEVVTLIDGRMSLFQCSGGDESSCRQFNRCTIRNPLAAIEERVRQLLEQITVDEISRSMSKPELPKPEIPMSDRIFLTALPMRG